MVLTTQTELLARAFRVIMAFIDNIVYWAVTEIYGLIDQISRINVFSESTISEFGERIYTIIGVLMLFKLASSIISYIVDPDKLTDSKKGFSSIVKNIVIMLVLIVTVPLIFRYAMALQYVVVSDDTIGRLITGKEGVEHNNTGNYMAVSILSNFIYPDSGIEGYPEGGCSYHEEHADGEQNDCEKALSKYSQYDLDKKFHDAFTTERGYNDLIGLATSPAKMGDGEYVIVYRPILSTLVGGFTAWVLLMFCIDIAVRIVKLGFLQLIAPIPIVTYMDDGGQGMFKKWVKACTSTYADLFIRLAAINFAIFIITSVIDNNFKMCSWSFADGTLSATCNERPKMLVQLFLILGSLMFAKQLPKLIEEITGLKLDGKFSLNPLKKLSEVPIIGTAGGNLARKTLAGIDAQRNGHTFKSGWYKAKESDKGFMADMRKTFDAALPYSAQARKRGFEAREQIEEQKTKLAKGKGYFAAATAAKNSIQGDDWNSVKAKNAAVANALFGKSKNPDLAKKYTEMMNAKEAKDRAASLLREAEATLHTGGSFHGRSGAELASYVKDLEINSGKAAGAYSAAESQFVKEVNSDDEARQIYESYNMYNDQQKFEGEGAESKLDTFANGSPISNSGDNTSSPSPGPTTSRTSTSTSAPASASAGPSPLDSDKWNNVGSTGGYGSDGEI